MPPPSVVNSANPSLMLSPTLKSDDGSPVIYVIVPSFPPAHFTVRDSCVPCVPTVAVYVADAIVIVEPAVNSSVKSIPVAVVSI